MQHRATPSDHNTYRNRAVRAPRRLSHRKQPNARTRVSTPLRTPHSEPDGASNHRAQQSQIAHRARKCGATARNASQPTRRATQETRTPHGRKAKRRRAGRRSATKPHPTQESRGGRKGLAPGLAPGPIPPAKRPHTTVWRQTRVRERSEVMTLHRRPVAALTNLSYTSKLQPVSNCTKCPR